MNHRLTGQVRFFQQRTGFFRHKYQLVVQVQETYDDGPTDHNGMPEYLAGTRWRDATPMDLNTIGISLHLTT